MTDIQPRIGASARKARPGPPPRTSHDGAVANARRAASMFFTPRWIALHLLVWGLAVTMVLLGRWQLIVSNSKHFDLQNFGYSLQWWAFSAFGLVLWARVVRDAWRGAAPAAEPTGGQLVVRTGHAGVTGTIAYAGPAQLVSRPNQPGQEPVVYRGYVMPQSATSPTVSDGDPLHGAYNDYLWQLALADAAKDAHRPQSRPDTTGPDELPRPIEAGSDGPATGPGHPGP